MPHPDISSRIGASTLTYYLSLGFINYLCKGKIGTALFRNLKVSSFMHISPSNSTKVLTPNTKTSLSYILENIV